MSVFSSCKQNFVATHFIITRTHICVCGIGLGLKTDPRIA
jgi:hypothetical protein